ncbi:MULTISPECIES: ATP-binding protein [Clostridium]|uniref:Ferredoxin n=1 Tax=Clostridium fessum TaxID=2126740 RepID=A0A2T3FPE0_9CLOT|nr:MULTISPECIES: 4Fe-4S binding protein [Clostridium]MBD9274756.1 ferredoxin [Clostridium sp.]MBS5463632.1 4Fe-4S binding protein [Clostridium sp.]MCC2171464.1 4Fe-4S binding protein [Clostridium fessum]MDR4024977.1 4Fe-4S binding protein [Clostridium sp.]PST37119.1 ferredoxin [Clostridium fessum]
MIRRIIEIDQKKCNGCGLCASACHEGAIGMVDGKAALLKDDYCDGLGDCLPACPTGAISFVEREAAAYDEAAVQVHMAARKAKQVLENANTAASANASARPAFSGCPGSMSRFLKRTESAPSEHDDTHADSAETFNPSDSASIPVSALQNWPVQIKLAPIHAPYFDGAKLLVAADCTAYAYSRFHQDFIHGKITLIGCPKLDSIDYSEKLTEIIRSNDIKSVTVVRMEVPCCGGIEQAVKNALQASGKFIPWQVTTISIDGRILD